mmetsp:Transcript_27764/g.42286  ORF Transcript_27764/g.42286 Transcript_27764/m.42286 type:complete len:659 (-) Transcript_27764:184-2160(-)
MPSRRVKAHAAVVVALSLMGLYVDYRFSNNSILRQRRTSIDLGGGDCEWTGAEKIDISKKPHGTLFASYPGAGMRLTWQMTEGASGISVGDDFFYSGKLGGLVKTQYPHPEGIWSYGKNMDQVILLIRNPRWNIPSYHTLLYELEYAHDYVVAYDNVFTAFSRRAPMENWIKWRDYRFEDEINLWAWYIDFWMEDGAQFWHNLDYERAGQYPFRYNRPNEKPWPLDAHCRIDVTDGCYPQTVVSYEKLRDPTKGPEELRRIADIIRYKRRMTMVSDEAINCIWMETWEKAPEPRNEDRDAGGITAGEYLFSIKQMSEIMAKLIFMKNKYSNGVYVLDLPARDLVRALHTYINQVGGELGDMYKNPPPTPAPSVGSAKALVDWYNTIGRGNRHAKDIVQHMASYWGLVEDLYDQEPTPAPTPCPSDFTGYNLNPTEEEWLDQHNIRRTAFFELKGLPPKNLTWSRDLQTSAENYAQKLADEAEPTAEAGCWLPNRLGGDQYGTQNTAMNRGLEIATPTNLLESWYDNEIDFTTEFPNITLHGPKFHATQVIFRSSKYVGCGQATKTNPANGEICNFHVCRYLGPGNCFLEAFTDVYTSFHSLFQEEDCMSKPEHADNYWICSVMSDHASEICQDPPELPVKPKDECIALMTAVQEEATV